MSFVVYLPAFILLFNCYRIFLPDIIPSINWNLSSSLYQAHFLLVTVPPLLIVQHGSDCDKYLKFPAVSSQLTKGIYLSHSIFLKLTFGNI
jgi:hypothetical protein